MVLDLFNSFNICYLYSFSYLYIVVACLPKRLILLLFTVQLHPPMFRRRFLTGTKKEIINQNLIIQKSIRIQKKLSHLRKQESDLLFTIHFIL